MRAPVALRAAYARTKYEAAGAIARVGRRSAAVDALLARLGARQGAFVTAWNPYSRQHPWRWNERMMRCLHDAVRGRRHAQGWGRAPDGRWAERHLLVAADPRWVAVLGRRFRQNAIMVVRHGQPGTLWMLRLR